VLWLGSGLSGCGGLPRIVILHDPLSAQEYLQLGRIYESRREWGAAISAYHSALKKGAPGAEVQRGLGDVYYRQKDYGAAEVAYRSGLRARPEDPLLLNNLASLYLTQGKKLKEAEALVKQALALEPRQRFVYLDTLGSISLAQGRPLEALESYQKAERLASGDLSLKAEIRAHREQAEAQLKKTAEKARGGLASGGPHVQ